MSSRSRDLASLAQHASRRLDFHQGKLLQDAHAVRLESRRAYNYMKHGVCMAATANWLRDRHHYFEEEPLQLIQEAMDLQYIYKRGITEDEKFLEHCGLIVLKLLWPVLPPNGLQQSVNIWQSWDTRARRLACVTFNVGSEGGHAIGLYQRPPRPLQVFDPNFGWYIMKQNCQNAFFGVLAGIYAPGQIKIHPVKVKKK